jgi:hypothetical protein
MDESCVWLQNSVHNLLYLVVKMVDEVEKVNLYHMLLNLLDLLLNVSVAAAKSIAGSSAECSESVAAAKSAAGSSLLNVRNLLLNATENV